MKLNPLVISASMKYLKDVMEKKTFSKLYVTQHLPPALPKPNIEPQQPHQNQKTKAPTNSMLESYIFKIFSVSR